MGAFSSSISATNNINSKRSCIPWPVLAETIIEGIFPPKPSTKISNWANSLLVFSGLVWGLSILFKATIMGMPANLAWEIASLVCSFGPSQLSTTKTAMSAIFAPRALKAEKASWPGVSIKVIFFSFFLI